MKRSHALFLATFIDIFIIFALYVLVYKPLNEVFSGMADRTNFIRYDATFFIVFAGIFFPVMHCIGLIETFLPRYFNRSVYTKVMWCSVIVPLVIGRYTARWVKHEILRHGYVHCESADTHMNFARFKVHVRELDTCRQLTIEKRGCRSGGLH